MSVVSKFIAATLAFYVAVASQVSTADASPGIVPVETAALSQVNMVVAATDHCKMPISAYGKAGGYAPKILKRQLARMRALSDWRKKVTTKHGTEFATWRSAKDREIECDASLGSLHCVAQARPCDAPALGALF